MTKEEAWEAALERHSAQLALLPGAQGVGIDPIFGGLVVYISQPEFAKHVPGSVDVEDEVCIPVRVPITTRVIGDVVLE